MISGLSPQPDPFSCCVLFLAYLVPPMSSPAPYPQMHDSQSFSQTLLRALGWHSQLAPG